MPINVKVNLAGLNAKLSDSSVRHARLAMANDAQQAMEQFVPKNEGNLRKDSNVAPDGSYIDYTMPYAAAQFYGFINGSRIHNYSTPGTSRRWDLRLKGDKEDMAKVKDAFVKGLLHYGNNG